MVPVVKQRALHQHLSATLGKWYSCSSLSPLNCSLLTRVRLTKQFLAACMIFIAARSSRNNLREMLFWSVPVKLVTMIVQMQGGGEWFNIGITEGLTGVLNGACAYLME